MNIFQNLKIKRYSKRLLSAIGYSDTSNIPNHVLQINDALQTIKTPASLLNESVGERLIDRIISSSYSSAYIDLLATFLDQGLPVSEKMLHRLEGFDMRTTYEHDYDGSLHLDQTRIPGVLHNETHAKNFIEVLDVLTSFGANWRTSSIKDRQYPTVLDYLYHNTQNYSAIIPKCLQQFYQNNEPQQNQLLSSKDIMRKRMEQMFADEQNDIQIQTGDRVVINAVPKQRSAT